MRRTPSAANGQTRKCCGATLRCRFGTAAALSTAAKLPSVSVCLFASVTKPNSQTPRLECCAPPDQACRELHKGRAQPQRVTGVVAPQVTRPATTGVWHCVCAAGLRGSGVLTFAAHDAQSKGMIVATSAARWNEFRNSKRRKLDSAWGLRK